MVLNTPLREAIHATGQQPEAVGRTVLVALIEEGGYDGVDAKAMETGIWAMLFGLWLSAHINPTPDHYGHSMRVLHVYLASVFPRHFDSEHHASIENK